MWFMLLANMNLLICEEILWLIIFKCFTKESLEVKVDELKTKTIIIDKKSYKTLVIFFVRYILKVSDTVLNEVLDKAKKIIGTKEFHNTKILINTDDK